jgi:aspartate-semialdehyde dehydrogenase
MVGSVLRQRMDAEGDWASVAPTFFSTSQAGQPAPVHGGRSGVLQDAHDIDALAKLPVLISCQGGSYTKAVHPKLRAAGWTGVWIDAASALRTAPSSCLVLDPINREAIERALDQGVRDYIGANCTVSLMLMGIGGLLQRGWVRWMTSMSYQAASGAGARQLAELIDQMGDLAEAAGTGAPLEREARVTARLRDPAHPTAAIGGPLAGSLLPWIDTEAAPGQSREEWKGGAEANRILGRDSDPIPIDGVCVRIGAMRSHSQALTLKLSRELPLAEIETLIAEANDWVRLVPNHRADSLRALTPAAVTGSLEIPIGRLRKPAMGGEYLTAFTVGDQLLWGAAEPLRRMLSLVR